MRWAGIVTLILLLVGTPIVRGGWPHQGVVEGPIGAVVRAAARCLPGAGLLSAAGEGPGTGRSASLPWRWAWGPCLSPSGAGGRLGVLLAALHGAAAANGFREAVGDRPLEVAATLRASPLDAFFTVAVPLAAPVS